jgi:hypothetical protein
VCIKNQLKSNKQKEIKWSDSDQCLSISKERERFKLFTYLSYIEGISMSFFFNNLYFFFIFTCIHLVQYGMYTVHCTVVYDCSITTCFDRTISYQTERTFFLKASQAVKRKQTDFPEWKFKNNI